MNNWLKTNADKFNALSLRERALLSLVIMVVILLGWWHFYAEPTGQKADLQHQQNNRIGAEVDATLAAIRKIRNRISAGVHQEKEQKLVQLRKELQAVEEHLRLKTVELIDPEDMFLLMSRLIYNESKLTLQSLKRREVKPAIALGEDQQEDAGIYRHVLEVKFSGKFVDILGYMQSLEAVDWKLIWDEIELVSSDYPDITVKLLISTLSTRKEWVGV